MSELKKKKIFRGRHLSLEEGVLVRRRFPETIHAKPTYHWEVNCFQAEEI